MVKEVKEEVVVDAIALADGGVWRGKSGGGDMMTTANGQLIQARRKGEGYVLQVSGGRVDISD